MIEPPINPAIGPIIASGATYPVIKLAVDVVSPAITGHSVFGVRQMFFARSTSPMMTPQALNEDATLYFNFSALNWNRKSYFLPFSAAPQTLRQRPAANP